MSAPCAWNLRLRIIDVAANPIEALVVDAGLDRDHPDVDCGAPVKIHES